MDEDEGFLTSDAELDSEVEDNDESELSVWLDQLNAIQQDGQPAKRRPPVPVKPRALSTPKQVMDNFRSSVMTNSGGDDVDLDAILGELCELETQLNVSLQKGEKGNSAKESGSATKVEKKNSVKEYGQATMLPSAVATNSNIVKVTPSEIATNFDSNNDLDLQLLSALSELTALAGSTFDDSPDTSSSTGPVLTTQNGACTERDQNEAVASSHTRQPSVTTHETRSKQNGGIAMATASCKQVCSRPISGGSIGHTRQLSVDASMHDSSPDGCDADSAFSDNASLPSSGSHVSVATTSSQNSASSSGVGVSSSPIPTAEQAAKLKEEKVKIALEKIKEANIKKLFVRIYTLDNSCKSILVDETMTIAQICDILVVKNHYKPNVHWSVVEELTEIYMERLIEDHEFLVENLLPWTRDSTNRLIFLERPDKYDVFLKPERYLLADTDADQREYKDDERQILIQEYFGSGQARIPRVETMLYLKSEGKKAWKKYHFVLRASGIYYNPKGKSKSSKDLVCLQKLDFVEVYTALGWKKKYKAPTEHGFALKHARIQKKTSKYIKYLCADDTATLVLWTTAMRVAKFGEQLRHNYDSAKENVATWDPNKVLMEPNKVSTDTSLVAKDECTATNKLVHAKKISMDASKVATDTREVAMDTDMVVMDTGRRVDYVSQPVVENSRCVATTGVVMDIDKVVMETNRHVVETIKVSTSPVKRGQSAQPTAVVTRQSSFVDHTRTLARQRAGSAQFNGTAATRQESVENSVVKTVPMLPVTTETTRHIAEQCVNTIKRSPIQNGKPKRTPSQKKPAPPLGKKPVPPPTPPKSMAVLQAQTSRTDFPAPPSPHTLQAFQLDGDTELAMDVPDGCSLGAVSRNRFLSGEASTPSRGSFRMHVPPAVAMKPQSPRPLSPRPVSSPDPESPQPNGGSPWHRRTSSGPVSPAVSAKPKPPPPPKRGLHTKLSFHGDSAQSKNFMADLQRTLAQKQPPRPGNKPSSPQVAAPGLVRGDSISDLPPPPPELMEGLEEGAYKRKVPPPLPKRSNATQLTTNK